MIENSLPGDADFRGMRIGLISSFVNVKLFAEAVTFYLNLYSFKKRYKFSLIIKNLYLTVK
jgi:hypothetical protein